jgi:type VI secretion system FHA domain protein
MQAVTLTLEVVGPEGDKLGAASRKVFQHAGGTIGRLVNNSWVLPDPYVSSQHAVIRHANGVFYIEDTSTNGIYINSPDNALVRGQPHALKSGDWIFIEPYEIRVVVAAELQQSAPSPFDDIASPAPPRPGRGDRSQEWRSTSPADIIPTAGEPELDPLKLIEGDEPVRPVARRVPTAVNLEAAPVWADSIDPPRPAPPISPAVPDSDAPIPENWFDDTTAGTPSARVQQRAGASRAEPSAVVRRPRAEVPPPAAREESKRAAPVSGAPTALPNRQVTDLAAVLEGAGLAGVPVSDEAAQNLGRILRVVIAGVMDMLRARQQTKSALGLDPTMFQRAENNPLKFSADVEDALHNLFVKRSAAFLGPVDAFGDAFDDVKHHQLAMLHGMRMAFEAMLSQFDPDRLQQTFDRQLKKGALLAVPAKLKYWELYRETFQEMVKDPESAFRQLFGDEFASAYEQQLKRLKQHPQDGNS